MYWYFCRLDLRCLQLRYFPTLTLLQIPNVFIPVSWSYLMTQRRSLKSINWWHGGTGKWFHEMIRWLLMKIIARYFLCIPMLNASHPRIVRLQGSVRNTQSTMRGVDVQLMVLTDGIFGANFGEYFGIQYILWSWFFNVTMLFVIFH